VLVTGNNALGNGQALKIISWLLEIMLNGQALKNISWLLEIMSW
jgi:hypothetical protein